MGTPSAARAQMLEAPLKSGRRECSYRLISIELTCSLQAEQPTVAVVTKLQVPTADIFSQENSKKAQTQRAARERTDEHLYRTALGCRGLSSVTANVARAQSCSAH